MKKVTTGVLAGTLAAAVAAGLSQAPATAAVRHDAPSQADRAPANRPDVRPGPLTARQNKLRAAAVKALLDGTAKKSAKAGGGSVVTLGKGKAVEFFDNDKQARVLSILSEFGDTVVGKYGGTAGPVHNDIPEPSRMVDNSTTWEPDYDKAYYEALFNGSGESMKSYYQQVSGGRYTVDTDPTLLLAGARAHNRWLAELCATSPERRAGIAIVPIFDVEAAVAEIRRARESGLRGGILIPSMWAPYPPYHDAVYDPVWATCAELGMPVHVHSGNADKGSYGPHVGIYVTEVRWWSARPLHFLLWSGVFERHPDLRFVVTECGAFWAADLLWMMDTAYDREHGARKLGGQLTAQLSMRPSEYFDRNCAIGASNTRRRELARRYEIGVGNLMWGNDFPHPEGTWPHTREWLRSAFHDIPVDETAQVLGLSAAEMYGFDVEALRPLADRIGPTPDDLGQTGEGLAQWEALAAAGRPWITGVEASPVAL